MSSAKILDGLRDAVSGNLGAVIIEGQRWVRAPEWRSMDSAPKDQPILLYVVQAGDAYTEAVGKTDGWVNIDVGYWEPGLNEWHTWHSGTPTHWMHLPEPPK